jgi:hypothetical protein
VSAVCLCPTGRAVRQQLVDIQCRRLDFRFGRRLRDRRLCGRVRGGHRGELLGGPYSNIGGFWGAPWLAPSNGDVDGSGCIDDADLLSVLFAFGNSGCCVFQDVNQDGVVDDADLLTVLFNFGQGC